MYAISTKAKDIRSVVVDLNSKRSTLVELRTKSGVESALAEPQARSQAASSMQPQHSHWTNFITEVSSNSVHSCELNKLQEETPATCWYRRVLSQTSTLKMSFLAQMRL